MRFVHGASDVEIYIHQPEGFVSKENPQKVLRLNRALYGLKQSPRIWYLCLCHVITSLGLEIMETDNSIYISTELCTILAVYVDDILILSKTDEESDRISLSNSVRLLVMPHTLTNYARSNLCILSHRPRYHLPYCLKRTLAFSAQLTSCPSALPARRE